MEAKRTRSAVVPGILGLLAIAAIGMSLKMPGVSAEPVSKKESDSITARQIVDRIKQQVTCPWQERTVDTFKAGDPGLKFTKFGLAVGAPGSLRQMKMLQRDDVEVLVAGESREWETVEYVRDAKDMGKKKAVILLGHAISEEAGMRYCGQWLRLFVKDVPVKFVPAGDPFWTP